MPIILNNKQAGQNLLKGLFYNFGQLLVLYLLVQALKVFMLDPEVDKDAELLVVDLIR